MATWLSDSFELIDPRFKRWRFPTCTWRSCYTGCRWAEGPAWFAAGRYLVWSDIPNDRMLRWDETDGSVSVFRQPAMNTNGHTVDREGRLVSCEHRGRCISRTGSTATRAVLVDRFEGKRFNSPNDLVVKSDGSIWFTDPSYGIDSDYEGDASAQRDRRAQRLPLRPGERARDRRRRRLRAAQRAGVLARRIAAVHRRHRLHAQGRRAAPRAPLQGGGRRPRRSSGGEVFATCAAGLYDGLRVDAHGNLWLSAGDGVHCHAPDGTLLGKIRVPETVANVCFGGAKLNRLFICGTTSLYSVYLNARAAPRG